MFCLNHGHFKRKYHGIGLTTKINRNLIPYAMSVWLRDTGARVKTGKPLYPIIQAERFGLN